MDDLMSFSKGNNHMNLSPVALEMSGYTHLAA